MYLDLFTISITNWMMDTFKNAGRWSGVFFALLLTACASTPQTTQLLTQPPQPLATQTELTQVAFYPQELYQCGPAALATMLTQQNINVNPDELVSKVYIPKRKGSLQIEMIATARNYGLLSYKLAPKLTDLLTEVSTGNPVLVFQNLALTWLPQWHYAVVVGYDLYKQQLILRSGTEKRHLVSLATFEQTWQRANYWAYVMVKPGNIPATANALNYTQAARDLNKAGFNSEALDAHRQAAVHWPQQLITHMTLGNAEFAADNLNAANQAFQQAITLVPDNAQAWNNLAYTLAAQQCPTAAINAINCAVKLAPTDPNIIASQAELSHQPQATSTHCSSVPRCPNNTP